MFRFLYQKQREVERRVGEYLDLWEECLARFREALETYLTKGLGEEFDFLLDRTHRAESRADDQRREIERYMYSKALLPESRGDILGLLEAMDRLPGGAQATLYMIADQRIDLPRAAEPDFRALLDATAESVDLLLGMTRRIFKKNASILEAVKRIDEKESRCDSLQRRLIEGAFGSSEMDGFGKLQFRDLVSRVGAISDDALEVGDRIVIMSLKRRV